MKSQAFLRTARDNFHAALLAGVLKTDRKGVPANADRHSKPSVQIARGILERLGPGSRGSRMAGQMAGADFEKVCADFIQETFSRLNHLRPGTWQVSRGLGTGRLTIAAFEQYSHLADLVAACDEYPTLATALGSDYLIKPDVLIVRSPEEDTTINAPSHFVDDQTARLTSIRRVNNDKPILHASISCKWTIRSDRAQNARSEALNLVRNRKGRLPHICVVTGEPTPNRIASLALGTGDIDCVYHFALPELQESVKELDFEDSCELLSTMIEGKRLKDISDLPLDLTV